MNLRKICSSSLWFLLGAVLFLIGGIKLYPDDKTGYIIYFIASALFLIGYIGQIKFNKKRK